MVEGLLTCLSPLEPQAMEMGQCVQNEVHLDEAGLEALDQMVLEAAVAAVSWVVAPVGVVAGEAECEQSAEVLH